MSPKKLIIGGLVLIVAVVLANIASEKILTKMEEKAVENG